MYISVAIYGSIDIASSNFELALPGVKHTPPYWVKHMTK